MHLPKEWPADIRRGDGRQAQNELTAGPARAELNHRRRGVDRRGTT